LDGLKNFAQNSFIIQRLLLDVIEAALFPSLYRQSSPSFHSALQREQLQTAFNSKSGEVLEKIEEVNASLAIIAKHWPVKPRIPMSQKKDIVVPMNSLPFLN
jgi:hypothetical protein